MARQPRIGFFGSPRVGRIDESRVNKIRALANITEQVGDIAFAKAAQQRQKEGELAGSQVDAQQGVELSEDDTIRGRAFNQAAITAYRFQIGIDSKAALDRMQEENKLDPEAFKAATDAYRKSTLQAMPEELAVLVGRDIDSSVSSRYSQLNKSFFQREERRQQSVVNQGIESATDDILNAARQGNSDRQQELIANQSALLNDAVESGILDPVKAVEIRENIKERIAQQEALKQVDDIAFADNLTLQEKVSRGTELIETVRNRDLKDLSPEQKDSLINVVSAKVGDLQRELANQLKEESIDMERQISNLKVNARLNLGDSSKLVEETETLFNSRDINESERTSILTDIYKGQRGAVKLAQDDSMVARKLSGEIGIVLDQKVVDSYYNRNVKDQLEGMSPDLKIANQAEYISRLRAVPKFIKQEISNNILSNDPDLIKQAGDLIDRIDEIDGLPELAVSENQRAFIESVVNLSQTMEPEQAVQISRELTDPRDKARVEFREQEIKTEKMREDYSDVVNDAFEGFFGQDLLVDNVNKQQVDSEYQNLFESFYKAGMDKDRAEEKAIEVLKGNWKESQFGFMKYPPETYYTVGQNSEYIRGQLVSDIKKNYIGREFDSDNVYLLSDETTSRQAAQSKPTYRVMIVDNNGEISVLGERWSPDMDKESKRQLKENEGKAREIRQEAEERLKAFDVSESFLKSLGGN